MKTHRTQQTRNAIALAIAVVLSCAAGAARAQNTDFCGCAGNPNSLGDFVSSEQTTWPAGTVQRNDFFGGCQDAIEIPLPPDGVVVFDSIDVDRTTSRGCSAHVTFSRNAANTPVTLLVKGNVTVRSGGRITVNGFPGGAGTNGGAGQPGLGGLGGFAGGEGAYRIVNFANIGGNGVGPGGGLGGTVSPATFAAGGVFVGVPELRPLLGGSGGGGGRSSADTAGHAAGGGGGGGGAILIAANGTIDIQSGGQILAEGASGGDRIGVGTAGGGGSGGAIRLLANRIQGSGQVFARGGSQTSCCGFDGLAGGPGRIRMEAIFNTFAADNTNPVAVRAPAPGPLVNPITPTVRITGIDGVVTPVDPIGFRNQVDMLVDAPGVIQIDLATTDVPVGTDVEVKVKPKVGGPPVAQLVTLVAGRCVSGACSADADFDLPAGAYIVEARATFQTPGVP